ncbi:uncharacterized protein LOC141804680 isoform X2 [Halichoeres trimaculatus]|uniref:uncharacterized protein LOC141804680 isoform X2 n=1 Tax=Halichoeres trimaculatus TaxID=147232 RepID=UPI003D9F4A33
MPEEYFFSVFGSKYDSALQALMKKFLLNLQELLPVPSLEQTSLWLTLSPAILKDCLDFMNQPQPLKTLIQHHKHHRNKVPQAFSSSGDDFILSSLSIHLPNVDPNKGSAQVKSEPMCDSPDWQRDDFLNRELKEDQEEDFKLLYPELVRNDEEHVQQCVDEETEDQGASVEVILPSFDETESSDDDHIDKKLTHHLKYSRRTSAKAFDCESGEDLSCGSKHKEHKISHSAIITKTNQLGPTSQSSSFEKINVHQVKSCSENKAETELSRMHYRNSELSNDDGGLVCHVCDKVFTCQKNFVNHQRICADVRKAQLESGSSSSSAHLPKPNAVDKTSSETSHEVPQASKYFYSSQDQMCKSLGCGKQCSICGEIISSSSDFTEHMKCHTEQRPVLCSHCGKDFESYDSYKTHQEGECTASTQHAKYCSLINDKKGDPGNTLVTRDTTTDVPKDSKTRKPLLTCEQCGMRFTYCKSFEKHQIKCSGEASHRKTKNYLIISGCDSFSADNTEKSHAGKSSKTEEETRSTVVLKSEEKCELQEDSKLKTSNQHVEDYSWSSENQRNQESTLVFRATSQTSTTGDAKALKPPLTCQECGLHFTYRISFKKHQKKCSASQRKTNRAYVTVSGCDVSLPDSFNTVNAEERSETSPSSKDFKSHEESEVLKEDACKTPIQHLDDFSFSSEIKRDHGNTSVSSETSQTFILSGASAASKALKPLLTCQKCGLRFTYYKSFEKHQKKCSSTTSQRKPKKNYLIISGCDFFSADDVDEGHDEKGSETMETTSSTADDAGGSKHKTRTFKCSMCEVNFSKIELLKRHYSELHDVRSPYPCTMCKRAFLTLYELVRHQQNKLLFLCPTCKKGFSNIGELKRHEKIHTANSNITPCSCETCGRNFKFRVNLIRHQRRHRERPPSVCSYCGKEFSTKDGLKAHMVRHTDGYPCPVCGKKFYQKAYLTYHLKRHTGQEKYLCDICGKGWPTVSLLKVHMVKHTEGQPFQCDDCGATYKRKSGLMAHHRDKHLGLRPFVCEICSKGFRINSQLKKHMSVHTGERPYSCPICSKRFTKSFNLKKHREKPCL